MGSGVPVSRLRPVDLGDELAWVVEDDLDEEGGQMSESSELGYYDRVNHDLLRLIPPDAKLVLEIGCGTGRLAEAYRRFNPEVKWIGVEIEPWPALHAEIPDRCSEVFIQNIETSFDSVLRFAGTIDCLVLGDVLEHLKEPWRILRGLSECIKPGGQVIACIPNAQHWTVIQALLHGEWEYEDEGLMDRTHLRWFTLKSSRKLFENAGLHVFDAKGRILKNEGHEEFIGEWFDSIDRDSELAVQTKVYQYLVRGLKPIPFEPRVPATMLIRYVMGCRVCEGVRCREPGQFLATIPGVKVEFHRAQTAEEVDALGEVDWAPKGFDHKILILQRRPFPAHLIDLFESEGWTIIFEIDDFPGYFPDVVADDAAVLKRCHAIQTTTDVMRDTILKLAPGSEVKVIPNQIAELPPFPKDKFEPSDRKTRIFFGAIDRENSWKPIMSELNRLAASHDNIEFVVVNDIGFFSALETEHKVLFPFLDYADYRSVLRSCDIALLPLADTEFNRHKSDLKFLECAAEGVAVVASRTVYGATNDSVSPMPTETNCFQIQMEKIMLEGATWWLLLACNAYCYVRDNRLLSQHYRDTYDWYLDVSQRRQAGELTIGESTAASSGTRPMTPSDPCQSLSGSQAELESASHP